MYDKIAQINQEIVKLKEQRDAEIVRMFNLGECDRQKHTFPRYPDSRWYMLGWEDADYQLEILSVVEPVWVD